MQYFQGEKIRLVPLTATRFLDCFSEVLMAHLMLEQGLVAREQLKDVALIPPTVSSTGEKSRR